MKLKQVKTIVQFKLNVILTLVRMEFSFFHCASVIVLIDKIA